MTTEPLVLDVAAIRCRFEPRPWTFALDARARIDEHWTRLVADKPALFNGEVLVMHRWSISGDLFEGAYLQTDYASFLAWRDFGFPDKDMRNCFAMAALTSADGAFVLGEMGPHTANGGAIYFPAGTPDLSDVTGDTVDLAGSVFRELEEETGIAERDVTADPGWTLVLAGTRIALMRRLRSPLSGPDLKARVEAHLAAQAEPELSRIHLVASMADLPHRRMPSFQQAYLAHRLPR